MTNDSIDPIDTTSLEKLPETSESEASASPWGFWATLGFALLVIVTFGLIDGLIAAPFLEPGTESEVSAQASAARLVQNGSYVSIKTIVSATLCVPLIVFFAWLRRGMKVRDYLALKQPRARDVSSWLIGAACFIAAADGLKLLLGRELVPEIWITLYTTSKFPPLLWLAVIVMAPLLEEFLFRGFLYAGWSRSRLGPAGTIVLTSLIWAAVHTQYDLYYVVTIFVFGIFAGFARYRTGSLVIPVLLHGFVNLVATIETVFVL